MPTSLGIVVKVEQLSIEYIYITLRYGVKSTLIKQSWGNIGHVRPQTGSYLKNGGRMLYSLNTILNMPSY